MKRLFYKAGCLLQVILLIAHLYNNRNGLPIPVVDEPSRLLTHLMQTTLIQYSVGKRTLTETLHGYDYTWAAFVVFTMLASLPLLFVRFGNQRRRGKYIAGINALLWLGCMVVTLLFWSLPQQLIFGFLALTFGLSYLLEWNPPKPKGTRICIVGAGIGGLTAAYQLQRQGYTQLTVLEKDTHVGGKCSSAHLDGHVFDLGGHEMLAGYNDIIAIADEVNAEHRRSIPPLVYDRDKHQYLNFKGAATLTGDFSMWQIMVASIRYLFLVAFTFRPFSKPSTGYRNIPPELTQSLEKWLESRNLTPLKDILSFVIKVQGYGSFRNTSAAHLVKFMGPKNWLSLLLSGLGISKKWPRVFTQGVENLCSRMAATLPDVRLNTSIRAIKRTTAAHGGITIYLQDDPDPLIVDKLILSLPLQLSGLDFIDLTASEKATFSQISHYRFINSLCRVEGLPAGVVASIPMNNINLGEFTGYIKDFADVPVALFFSLVDETITGEQVKEQIRYVLTTMPAYNGQKPCITEFVQQHDWAYFPHFALKPLADGLYTKLEDLQGQNNTYYASSLLSFECIGNTAAYAKQLVQDKF